MITAEAARTLHGLGLSSGPGVVLTPTWLIPLLAVALSCAGTTHRRRPLKTTTQDYVADRVLPGSKVRMVVSLDADGAELRFVTEQVCVSETKRTTRDVEAKITETVDHQDIRCNRRQLAGADIIVTDIHGVTLQTGTTTAGGEWRLSWADLTPAQLMGLAKGPALVAVEGKGTVGTVTVESEPGYVAHLMIEKAKGLAADDKVDEAEDAAKLGEQLGADATAARAAIARRRELDADLAKQAKAEAEKQAQIQQHLAAAKQAIKEDDPQTAKAELDQAEALGGVVTALREAAEATPKAKKLAKEAERAQKKEERQRAEQERQEEARARKLAKEAERAEEREKRQAERVAAAEKVAADRATAAASALPLSLVKKFHLRSASASSNAMSDSIMRNSATAPNGCAEAELGWTLTPKVVQRMGPDEYEVDLTIIHFGGNEEYPIIFHATRSTFASTGRLWFPFPCILSKYGTRQVEFRNGFSNELMVVVEDPRPRKKN